MIKSITVTNYLGDRLKLELTRPERSGFAVKSVTGLGPGKANINVSEMSTTDGGLVRSTRLPARNIVLSLEFLWGSTIEDTRQKSYRYFPIKKQVTLLFETDNRVAEISGIVESNDPTIFSKREGAEISIICPDPYFYSAGKDGVVSTAFYGSEPLFEFPFSNEGVTESTSTTLEAPTIYLEEGYIIKAGTYRFNDVVSNPDIVPDVDIFEQNINFTTVATIDGYGEFVLECSRIYHDGSGCISYTAISSTPDIGGEYPLTSYVYSTQTGWGNGVYGDSLKYITIPVDTEVSGEFKPWFTTNTKRLDVEETPDIVPNYTVTPLIEMSSILKASERVIFYEGDAEIGVTITIHALGEAGNITFTLRNGNADGSMTIDTEKIKTLTGSPIMAGDDIVISTLTGNKFVNLIRNGETTRILNCLGKDINWFQLTKGENVLTYTADDGLQNLNVVVENRVRYEGV